MTSRPILFSAPMVRALLDGTKTQTRRVVKLQPKNGAALETGVYTAINQREKERFANHDKLLLLTSTPDGKLRQPCPYGQVGDQLWVRETWSPGDEMVFNTIKDDPETVLYRADKSALGWDGKAMTIRYDTFAFNWEVMKWKPSIFMPRWASRITLEITGVRVERLQDISDSDCKAEGVQVENSYDFTFSHVDREHHHELLQGSYATLWESLNGAGTWDLNPWVWVIEFKKVKP